MELYVCFETNFNNVGFEALTSVVAKNAVFWYITPCISLEVNRRFGRAYHLFIQVRWIRWARYQRTTRRRIPEDIALRLTVLLMSLLLSAVTARRLNGKAMSVAAGAPLPVDLLTYYSPSFPFLLSFQTKFVWQNSLLDFFLPISRLMLCPPLASLSGWCTFVLLEATYVYRYVLCHP
jgi:hypothetical protein